MANTGPAKTKRAQREICVKEEFKIAVKIALDRFRFEEKQKGNPLDFLRIKMCPFVPFSIYHQPQKIYL